MQLQGVLLQEVLDLKDLVKPYLGMRSMEALMRSFFGNFMCYASLLFGGIIRWVICFIFRHLKPEYLYALVIAFC
jgi:hypothetical protein